MSSDLTFFDAIDASMEQEAIRKDEIYRAVREFEKTCRSMTAILNRVHSEQYEQGPEIAQSALDRFVDVKAHLSKLASLVPHQQYYRYNDQWSRTVQNAVYLAMYATYLKTERLMTVEELEELTGTKVNLDNSHQDFHISIEEFLHSYISLTGELVRLAVNAVTAGNYSRPLRISKFVKELYAGFQMLNLKNDSLRKRFDGIKYNIKKIEEVVYDISLRKLNTQTSPTMEL